jgi:hypothetical protein
MKSDHLLNADGWVRALILIVFAAWFKNNHFLVRRVESIKNHSWAKKY